MSLSLWIDRSPLSAIPERPLPDQVDVAIAGGGLTGLVSAVLLARAGKRVAVLEARRVGAVTTGNTTAKISLLQGTRLSTIRKKHPVDIARAYVDANRAGQQWLVQYCEERGIAVQTQPSFTYAVTASGERQARQELAAADEAGLAVTWQDHLDLPFHTQGAVRLDGQFQFNPMDALAALVAELDSLGGQIHELTRVTRVRRKDSRQVITTSRGTTAADAVLVATGMPILDRGGFFARLEPLRSYAAAFDVEQPPPEGMYLSTDSPSRSIRSAPNGSGHLLITGGNGHVVGRASSPAALVAELTDWTTKTFSGAARTHWWSAQDYEALDELPYVGPLTPGNDAIRVATGYAKWGMTNAVAAALTLTGQVLDKPVAWQPALQSWRPREVSGTGRALKLNATVGGRMAVGYAAALAKSRSDTPPAEGNGRVARHGVHPVATCTVDGQTHHVSAVCPHLKGIVRWNDAEKSWDCPLHGSRFAPTGEVLEGPAVTGLAAAT